MNTTTLKKVISVTGLFLVTSLFFNNCGQQGDVTLSSLEMSSTAPNISIAPGEDLALINMVKSVDLSDQDKVDIIVVDDNSGSMKPYQSSLASRFSSFIGNIPALHWQLGIITTDLLSPTNYSDGRVVRLQDSSYILNDTIPSDRMQSLFNQAIVRPESEDSAASKYTSCEQGIKATYRALERSLSQDSADAANKALIRDDASLAVIIVTNSDESTNVTDKSCPNKPDDKNSPEGLQALVASKFPGKAFSFHSIIVKSGDKTCLTAKNSSGSTFNELYGVAYEKISALTNGLVGSVCDLDYGTQLKKIGTSVSNMAKQITLDCDPVDLDQDGKPDVVIVDAKGSFVTDYTINNRTISFTSQLAAGTTSVKYKCKK